MWEEIVSDTENCVNLVNDDDEGELAEGLKDSLEDLRYKKDRLILLEEDLEKETSC